MTEEPGRHFRWSLLVVPLGVSTCVVLLLQVRPAFSFDELAEMLGARMPAYARLGVLAAVLVGVTLLVKVFRDR